MMPAGAASQQQRPDARGPVRPPAPPVPPPAGLGSGGPGSGGPAREPSHRTAGGVLAGRIVTAFIAVVVLVVCGVAFFVNPHGNSNAAAEALQAAPATPGKGMNLLLIGSDSRSDAQGNPLTAAELKEVATEASGGTNTDTIMVLHVPAGGGKATAVSIPRDTWIDQSIVTGLPGPYGTGATGDYKPNKVNSFYGTAKSYEQQVLARKGVNGAQREFQSSEAGRKMLIQVISKFTGLHIDHYAEVNLIAFYQISNAVGGVPVCLKSAVKDSYSGADFKAGYQQVQGTAALSFVRQRHGLPGGDLDRVRRQQAFLAGAIKKVESSPTTVPALVTAASKSLVMDTKLDLMSLAQQMEKLSSGNVSFTTIPTHGTARGIGTDALADDPAEVRAFFARLDGPAGTTSARKSTAPSTSPATPKMTVQVESGAMQAGLGKSVAATLTTAGFTVTAPTDLPGKSESNQVVTTQIHYAASALTAATRVQKALGYGVLKPDSGVAAGHVLVIAGKDAVGQRLRAPMPALVLAPTTTAAPNSINGVQCIN